MAVQIVTVICVAVIAIKVLGQIVQPYRRQREFYDDSCWTGGGEQTLEQEIYQTWLRDK